MITLAIEAYKDVIEDILIHHAEARDDDSLLYCLVLKWMGEDCAKLTVNDMFHKIRQAEIPSFDTVARLRRMVQMSNVNLRGAKWSDRHQQGLDVRDQIRYGA